MISNIFTSIDGNLHEELYKDLPEINIGERIKKVRLRLHIDRIQFAKSLHCEIKTVVLWKTNKIIPEATSIKKISDTYNIPLEYFHKYYYVYYNDPQDVFLEWKKKNGFTYKDLGKMINSSISTIYHFASGSPWRNAPLPALLSVLSLSLDLNIPDRIFIGITLPSKNSHKKTTYHLIDDLCYFLYYLLSSVSKECTIYRRKYPINITNAFVNP